VQLVGRAREIDRAFLALSKPWAIVAIEGLGGMGKTAIAQEVVWRIVDGSSEGARALDIEGVVWVADRQGDLRLDGLLDEIAAVLKRPYLRTQEPGLKSDSVLRELDARRYLIVIDNYDTVSDPGIDRFIRMLPSQCRLILTTRESYEGDAWSVSVKGLDRSAALSLVRQQGQRLDAPALSEMTAEEFDELYAATGGNPQAIRLAVSQLRLAPIGEAVKVFRGAVDEMFIAIFHHSWYEVLVNDDYARRVLMVMGLHPGPVAREALEAGADVHGPSLTKAITRLIGLSLLDTSAARGSPTPDFEIHTLTASFVVGVLRSEPAVRVDLEARLVSYYLDLAVRHSPTVLSVEHVRALERERANILCFAQSCYRVATDRGDVGSLRQVVSFAEALASYLWARGYWQDQLEVCGRALDAASRIGDADSAVEQRCLIGRIHVWRGELMKAREQLEASEAVLAQVGSEAVRARALRLRAWIASHQGDHREATACLERVLETAPDTHDDHGRAATLVDLGVEAEATGEMQLALDRYREALVLDEAVSCLEGAAVSLSHLADVELELGLHDDARRHYSDGLAKAKVVDRLSTIGRCQRGLARVLCQEGQFDDARRHAVWAAESYRRLGIPELEAEASSLVDDADAGLASVDRVDEDEVDSETV
jgi:tetratricopeptide (TPR) repeat protein